MAQDEGCVQEVAGFGPPCSDPLCESCRAREKAVCEEHGIALTPYIVAVTEEDEHGTPETPICRLCFTEDAIYEQSHRIIALQADNHRLRAAIGRHRDKVMSLGTNVDRRGKPVHGGEWDRDLWSALYDYAGRSCDCDERRGELDGRCVDCGGPV